MSTLSPGTLLGPYKVLKPLGKGGMGEVWVAWDARLERDVAIKMLPEHLATDHAALTLFKREAKAVAALSHPNVLAIYDIGVDRGVTYMVTELLVGETFRQRTVRGPLGWREAAEKIAAVADGLAAAHSKGVIHRDLKPENLFLAADGDVKILDFGLSHRIKMPDKVENDTDRDTTEALSEVLSEGVVMGTPGYVAPERLQGTIGEAPSDIFSLGCVLYELIAGRRPFGGRGVTNVLTSILSDPTPRLSDVGVDAPGELQRLIASCLEKDPQERYQTAKALAADLRALLASPHAVSSTPRRKTIDAIAVLPFENGGAQPDADYFCDGVTESIINNLAQLTKLRVIARSTVFRYKGKEIDPARVARDLNVRALVTGRIVQRGDQLNLSVEMVRAADGVQLWGERYVRPASDILRLEAEIAAEISSKLKITLTGADKQRLAKRFTQDPDAYQAYLKGRFFWNKRSPDAVFKSITYFEQAIEKDPRYALAYSGLSDAYSVISTYSIREPHLIFPKAKAAALKALEIDEAIAEAHVSRACVALWWDWDWATVEREGARALQLNRNYATLHHWMSFYWGARRQFDRGLEEIRLAQELDPLSLIISTHRGWFLYFMRQYDAAIDQYRSTLDLDPHFVMAHYLLGTAYIQTGRYDDALAAIDQALALTRRGGIEMTEMIAVRGGALAAAGRRSEAEQVLEQLLQLRAQRYVSPYDIATVYVALGDADRAFEWLATAYQQRSQWMVGLGADPRLDPIRADPRFEDYVRRLKLDS